MIQDAQDGTTGRRVWEIQQYNGPGRVYVIAGSAENAIAFIATEGGIPPEALTATDRGSADRTEIGMWRDERYLDPPNAPTDTTPERGA